MEWKNRILFTVVLCFITGFAFSQNKLPEIEVKTLSSNLYKFSCSVNNWLVLTGPDGVLLSDSAPEMYGEAMKLQLRKLGIDDVKIIINTHWHHDHTGGNLLFGRDATVIAHHSVREDLAARKHISLFDEYFEAFPDHALPDLTFSAGMKIYFNEEEITIKHFPNGHTAGDAVVHFKNADVVHVGDLIVMDQFPPIDIDNGGDVEKLIENLKIIISEISSDTKIVSGHLRDATKQDMIEYCDMLLATVEIVKEEMKLGAGLKEMQEKEILRDWENWGKHITCDKWIETIYRCLSR
jgi:cyclase